MSEAIPAVERGKPRTMAEDVIESEIRHLKKQRNKPNPMDHRGI